ncbi:MAG: hypothetical protein LUD81_04255 [Clostridiales bacterium]|nr:hypothetical protein [Clostridiales bacterium]
MTAEELRGLLESYRELQPQDPERLYINRLIEESRRRACIDTDKSKKLHNFIILWFIAKWPPKKQPICRTLHISSNCKDFENTIVKAVDRLLTISESL